MDRDQCKDCEVRDNDPHVPAQLVDCDPETKMMNIQLGSVHVHGECSRLARNHLVKFISEIPLVMKIL